MTAVCRCAYERRAAAGAGPAGRGDRAVLAGAAACRRGGAADGRLAPVHRRDRRVRGHCRLRRSERGPDRAAVRDRRRAGAHRAGAADQQLHPARGPRRRDRVAGGADAVGGGDGLGDELHRGGGHLHSDRAAHRPQQPDRTGTADDAVERGGAVQRHDDPGGHRAQPGGARRTSAQGLRRVRVLRFPAVRRAGAGAGHRLDAVRAALAGGWDAGGAVIACATAAGLDRPVPAGGPRVPGAGGRGVAPGRARCGRSRGGSGGGGERAGGRAPGQFRPARARIAPGPAAAARRCAAAGPARPGDRRARAVRAAGPGAAAAGRRVFFRLCQRHRHGRDDGGGQFAVGRGQRQPCTAAGPPRPGCDRAQARAHGRGARPGRGAAGSGRYPAGGRAVAGDPRPGFRSGRPDPAQPGLGGRRGFTGGGALAVRAGLPAADPRPDGVRDRAQRAGRVDRLPADGADRLRGPAQRLPLHPLAQPGADRGHAAVLAGAAAYRRGGVGRRPAGARRR